LKQIARSHKGIKIIPDPRGNFQPVVVGSANIYLVLRANAVVAIVMIMLAGIAKLLEFNIAMAPI